MIPQIAIELCPEFTKEFSDIEKSIELLKSKMLDVVRPNVNPITPRIIWKYQIYIQCVLYRTVDLAESILFDWDRKKIGSAFIVSRALFENVSLFYYSAKHLEDLTIEGSFNKLDKFVDELIFSTRLEDTEMFKAISILTIVQKIDKIIPSYLMHYNMLCEYTHPNHLALMGLYGNMENEFTCKFSFETSVTKNSVQIIFSLLQATLNSSVLALLLIEKEMKKIWDISEQDRIQKGIHYE
jgi:hypothetical protein